MNQLTALRSLVLLSLALGVVGAALDTVIPKLIPITVQNAYDAYAEADTRILLPLLVGIFAIVIFVISVIALVGLLLMKPWARGISVWTTVLALATYPFFGPMVYSGWAAMLVEVSMMLWGAALAMCYFSDLRVHFGRNDR
ncbi:MAG: hypothetical protein J0L88_07225 [Xanthomonadales bacterium]|nr:hypothetical protein [Xanthomonadales bacterium]